MKSSLSSSMHKVEHSWNTYPYYIVLLACTGSTDTKRFVENCAGTLMVCDSNREDFSGVWLYSTPAELGFNTAEEALIGFDAAMAHRYRGIS